MWPLPIMTLFFFFFFFLFVCFLFCFVFCFLCLFVYPGIQDTQTYDVYIKTVEPISQVLEHQQGPAQHLQIGFHWFLTYYKNKIFLEEQEEDYLQS